MVTIAGILITGIAFARNNPYLTSDYFQAKFATIWYRILFLAIAAEEPEGQAQDIPVLLYHGIVTASDGSNTPNEHFKDQMTALKRAGYETITLQDLYDFLREGKELPAKSIVITFDDGRNDSYYGADPILAALGYKASMFLITKQSLSEKSQYYLNKKEVEQMLRTGRWEVGSHGANAHEFYAVDASGKTGHFFSNKLWISDKGRLETEEEFTARITADLTDSKSGLEKTLEVKVIGFAFPFGNFGFPTENFRGSEEIVIRKSKEIYPLSFYQFATGQRFNSNYRGHFNNEPHLFVKRIEVEADWTGEDLLRRVENADAKEMPFKDNFKNDRGWIKTWGELALSENSLLMHPAQGETGSAAILDGTGAWRNYEFTARVAEMRGSNLYLWARFVNDDNFVACNFGPDRTQIEQVFQGNKHAIKGEVGSSLPREREFHASIKVDERRVGCYLNGRLTVQSDFLEPSLEVGGIGIKGWDERVDTSRILVKEIRVEPSGEAQTLRTEENQPIRRKSFSQFFDLGNPSTTSTVPTPTINQTPASTSETSSSTENSSTHRRKGRIKLPFIDLRSDDD